ncbi:MAG: hypothetical protein OXG35_08075 [Acidobacteria bacterium]|nr:hypothetical protein [Acidobacteriota bacterium]
MLDVLKMLEACAPRHRVVETTHSFLVKPATGTAVVTAVFPSGPHLKLERRRIRSSAVRSLARKLGILDCARRHLPL